jgi:hypothetical protein
MRELETDYLVVGAGASGLAFVDTLVAESDAEVVLVDRRHGPGGHWLDAYPFVRLHQPSACYGVSSRPLGDDRIDEVGPNAGFYERAMAVEICEYFLRVLEHHVASGQVRFFGMSDYRGGDDGVHHFVSLLTGEDTTVRVRRRLVDATYTESEIPSRHTPTFDVDPGVRFIPPNDLVDLQEPATRYTVVGAGKTAMDTCSWLLDEGVDQGRIRWLRPRDGWAFNRAFFQPLEMVGSFMQLQARWVEAAAAAESSRDFALRLEADGVLMRIDPAVEPTVFRGPTLSVPERDSLRQIEDVVRLGKVKRIGTDQVALEEGTIEADPHDVYVDCTAAGVRPIVPRPIFEPGRITLQYVTLGIVPWGAATVGAVEAMRDDDAERNRLCPVVVFSGNASDLLRIARAGMSGLGARAVEPDLAAWDASCRLNPARAATDHLDDPRVTESFTVIATNLELAMHNLTERLGPTAASPV